ncbi:group III truncated hemoglobin [Shivajiella indica]|uniref:Group III truncated hemoglobin n=1 Tax=Shivajiella indica TaxID=872115 RepID=A0ABW5B976_9BACT
MERKEIEKRKDISTLVRTFYSKVRLHEVLGPVFNTVVNDWEVHLEHLTDFWEMVLLQSGPGAGKFNPIPVHREVDNQSQNQISEFHFNNWLELWFETLDQHFKGEVADYAKSHAQKMAYILLFKIREGRTKNQVGN